MIDILIDRLNQLCRKFVTDEHHFTEGDEIRKVFKEIKDLGYSIYSEQGLINSIVTEFLTGQGKQKYNAMLEYHQKKLGAVELKNFESAADFRDMERQLEREVMIDYMKKEGVANFRILDREKKEILCYLYCEFLTQFFKIEIQSFVE